MIDFKNKFNNNLKLFEKIQKKLNQRKKIISVLNWFSSFYTIFDKKKILNSFFSILFYLFISLAFFTILFLPYFFNNVEFSITVTNIILILFFFVVATCSLICFFSDIIGLFITPKFLKNKFSKKEILLIKKFRINKIYDINNIISFTFNHYSIKKEDFNDIVAIFNKNKESINKNKLFLNVKNNFIKQYKKSKISSNELKHSINFFINSFYIKDNNLIKKTYLEIENLTFDEKDENQNSNFNFQTNKKESIIF